ncbi:MAG TPA: ABC transporter substrate-binding protein [Candidatus Binatia bacterium]|jgi:NitT/TauT family transport system substrate-binding protein|nr:ABC transporter substrate-binding protein [Candidatus Binatia bacterium]
MKKAFAAALLFFLAIALQSHAAELPLIRIAHGAYNEKIAAMWIGVEQGFFRKHGVNVEVINIRSGPQTIAALAAGEIQIAYTIPGTILSAAAGGMDLAFFAGIVNRADGDFMTAPAIKSGEELKGKRVGVQSIGGGVWSMTMLALEHLGLDPTRDKITLLLLGDQSVLTPALATGVIDAAYLSETYSATVKAKGFNVLVDMAKAPIPYQGLALAAPRSYIKQRPQIIDALLRGVVESIAFIQQPAQKQSVVKSLVKNLRLKNPRDAESGYDALQWLYSLDIRPTLNGVENMHRLLSLTNPKMKSVKSEDVVDDAPAERLQKSQFYRDLAARKK